MMRGIKVFALMAFAAVVLARDSTYSTRYKPKFRQPCIPGVATSGKSCQCYEVYCQPYGYVCTPGRKNSVMTHLTVLAERNLFGHKGLCVEQTNAGSSSSGLNLHNDGQVDFVKKQLMNRLRSKGSTKTAAAGGAACTDKGYWFRSCCDPGTRKTSGYCIRGFKTKTCCSQAGSAPKESALAKLIKLLEKVH